MRSLSIVRKPYDTDKQNPKVSVLELSLPFFLLKAGYIGFYSGDEVARIRAREVEYEIL